jgi:hypothetical protein
MATTINASTSGLIETSDGTAVLDLQTGGTTALRVNASQAIGVGSSPSFGTAGQFLTSQGNAASPTWTSGGSGTVTSVSWTGGIVSIATATSTPAFTIAGTSGGIPYFSSGSTWASSAALTQYGVVYGGGAGAAPVATAAGTTGQFLGANTGGAPTWQTPSGGGSPGGSNTYVQYNSSGSFAGSANMTFNGTTLTLANDLTVGIGTYRIGNGGDGSNVFFTQSGASTVITGTAFQNTAIGQFALSSQTATGYTVNTAIGVASLRYVTSGINNTAFGGACGTSITTGSSNTLVGYAVDAAAGATSHIVIGNNVTGQANSNVTIGNNIGKIYNAYTVNATWTQTSDGRLKANIQDDSLGLSFINRLRPVTFNWKASNEIDPSLPYYNEVNQRDTTTVIHGLIAQEVKAALDAEGCSTFNGWDAGNEDTIQAISREMFISPLIKAIQELTARLETLEAKVV